MRRVQRAPWSAAGGALAAGLMVLCLATPGQTDELPELDLSVLEPGVRETLAEARSRFEARSAAAENDVALAAAWGRLGMSYQAHHLQGAAAECYGRAVELDPGEFRWQYYLGYLHQELGEYEDALVRYEQALAVDGGYLPARLRSGRARLALQDLDGAAADFRRVLDKDPDNAGALAGLGQVALRQREFQEAVDYLEAALQADSNADRLYYPLAMAYRQAGDAEQARAHLARVGETEPMVQDPVLAEMARLTRSAQMYLEQGYAASRAGRLREAVEAFNRAVEFNPEDVTARVSLGQGLVLIGDYDGALKEFDRALELDPSHPVARYRRGTLLEEAGDDAGAAVEYAAALDADPGYAQAGIRLGDALMRLDRYEEAARAYASIELAGEQQALIRYRQGLAYLAGGNCGQAARELESAFELKRDSGEIYQALSRTYSTCLPAGDPRRAEALELARALFEARPDEAHAETLAMAAAATGNFPRAVEMQQKVLESSRRRNDRYSGWRQALLERYIAGKNADQAWPPGHPAYRPVRLGAGPQPPAGR